MWYWCPSSIDAFILSLRVPHCKTSNSLPLQILYFLQSLSSFYVPLLFDHDNRWGSNAIPSAFTPSSLELLSTTFEFVLLCKQCISGPPLDYSQKGYLQLVNYWYLILPKKNSLLNNSPQSHSYLPLLTHSSTELHLPSFKYFCAQNGPFSSTVLFDPAIADPWNWFRQRFSLEVSTLRLVIDWWLFQLEESQPS